MSWQRGARLGIDVGEVRIGVARCGADGLMCTPVETVNRRTCAQEGVRRIAELVQEYGVIRLYVGLPLSMDGSEGQAAVAVRSYSTALHALIAPVDVRLVDERLSTVSAHRSLHDAGLQGRKHRLVVDQVAAVTILESAVAFEKTQQGVAGFPLDVGSSQ